MADWCLDKKLHCVIMNELLWKTKGYPLPCKDTGWTLYRDKNWVELATKKNFSQAIVRNIWTNMKKYTDENALLTSCANPMKNRTDKSENGVVPPIFHLIPEFYTKV